MSKEYEAYQTWLAHCIEQGMVVRIVTQQRTPNGYITFTGDVKGMLKANEFHLTFREVEAINTPTQDELRCLLIEFDKSCPECQGLGHGGDGCTYCWNNNTANIAIDKMLADIEAYKDNACRELLDRIEQIKWRANSLAEYGAEELLENLLVAERNNLNKSKEEK